MFVGVSAQYTIKTVLGGVQADCCPVFFSQDSLCVAGSVFFSYPVLQLSVHFSGADHLPLDRVMVTWLFETVPFAELMFVLSQATCLVFATKVVPSRCSFALHFFCFSCNSCFTCHSISLLSCTSPCLFCSRCFTEWISLYKTDRKAIVSKSSTCIGSI